MDVNADSTNMPTPTIPEDIDNYMAYRAWNAALEEVEKIVEWSSFWDNGRSIGEYIEKLKIP